MSSSQSSDSTLQGDSFVNTPEASRLDFSHLPSIYVLPAHLSEDELHEAEHALVTCGALLTHEIKDSRIVLGNISKERRARFELRTAQVRTESLDRSKRNVSSSPLDIPSEAPVTKRSKLTDLRRSSEWGPVTSAADDATRLGICSSAEDEANKAKNLMPQLSNTAPGSKITAANHEPKLLRLKEQDFDSRIKVVKLEWLHDCLKKHSLQPFEQYTIYEARLILPGSIVASERPPQPSINKGTTLTISEQPEPGKEVIKGIIERAKADAEVNSNPSIRRARKRDHIKDAMSKDFTGRTFTSFASDRRRLQPLRQTTSENDEDFVGPMPTTPDWVKENKIYSCERSTLAHPPNEAFIEQLKKIRTARLLTADDIGVRAYSTSIASLAAYPHRISSAKEILSIPGCDQKTAQLFHEWQESNGHLQAIADIDGDPVLQVLNLFYDIWGVGATTAREFYYGREWRDLDDIIEYGWKSLTRVQQIGVKYYDEFKLKIPAAEVEFIAGEIKAHAVRLTDSSLEAIIVGGHRRGNLESGDVDVILTHRSERVTLNLISDVVDSLEASGSITHVLSLSLTNSKRDQQPLPLRSLTSPAGHGFDTLDKALVVWQDQNWPSSAADLAADPEAKNPNPHRRVDIIVSPWRTIGCAAVGWTSGTTFNRDMRRYVKRVKGWKFDSSGVRERGSGRWMDLEGWADEKTRCMDWIEAEKRVFREMGLVYREPWERCTG